MVALRALLTTFAFLGAGALVGWALLAPPARAPAPAAPAPAAPAAAPAAPAPGRPGPGGPAPGASAPPPPSLRLERLGPRAARLVGPGGRDLGRLAVDAQGKVSGDALGKLPLHAARLGAEVRVEAPAGLAPEVAEKVAVLLRQSGSLATIAPVGS